MRRRPRRFVVITSPRSGSNHLISLIRQHPCIQAFYELLHEDPQQRARWKGTRFQEHETVEQFLERVYQHYYHPFTRAVGFKLFYSEAQQAPLADVWPYLAEQSELYVIELVRRNRFHQFVSLEVARMTLVWDERKDLDPSKRPAYPKLEISASRFQEYMENQARLRAQAFAHLPQEHLCELYYEDLCQQRAETLRRIYSFLGVWTVPYCWAVREELEKQRRIPVSEQVLNYYDLKQEFAGSPYAEYFV